MSTEAEFEAFRAMMMSQFARLAEQAGRYISRMSNQDRESVLKKALDEAWALADLFDPLDGTLLGYWDYQLREAVRSRDGYQLRHLEGWRWTPSQEIGGFFDA